MRKKQIWRFYCEHCKKSGGSSYYMHRHEERCTLNPTRICGMCKTMDNEQPELSKLIALLPNPDNYRVQREEEGFNFESLVGLDEAVIKVLPSLRDMSANCPACILAALRQARIPIPLVSDFNFTEECKAFWAELNRERAE